MNRRVVITGAGLISPLGNHPDTLRESLYARRSGVAALQRIPADYLPSAFGAEARDFTGDIEQFGPLEKTLQRNIKKGIKLMCREIQMGVASAQLCLTDAGLSPDRRSSERTGVTFGSDHIMTIPEEFTDGIRNCLNAEGKFEFSRWGKDGLPKVDPMWLLRYLPNMPASHIAIYNDLRGPSNSITLREPSSNLAVAESASTIERNSADVMIAGATGTRIHALRTIHVCLQEEIARGSVGESLSRPFDADRNGSVLGEGAGAILLEELTHAQARNAKILGEVVGYGASTVMERNGRADLRGSLRNVLTQSLSSSGIAPQQIGHIHAHGLATRVSDQAEAQAIHDVFGEVRVPVIAAKSYFGNLGAGSGVVELIASLQCFATGKLFPTLNHHKRDAECPVNVVTQDDHPAGDSFINLNISPQGQASAIVIRRYPVA